METYIEYPKEEKKKREVRFPCLMESVVDSDVRVLFFNQNEGVEVGPGGSVGMDIRDDWEIREFGLVPIGTKLTLIQDI